MISKENLKLIGQLAVTILLFGVSFLLVKENKVVGYISLVFWGSIIVVFLISLVPDSMFGWVGSLRSIFGKKSYIEGADPPSIIIEKAVSTDDEVAEEWFRVCNKKFEGFHGVSAIRVDDEKYPWYVYFNAGEFIREEEFAPELYETICKALLAVPGVRDAHHEDTEKFVLTGSPDGKNLVESVSQSIDQFMVGYYERYSKT